MSLVIWDCCLLTEIVKKKQMSMSRAMVIRKMKLDKVSKPNQLARAVNGSGKMATTIKMIGKKSQATEFLMDMELRLRHIIIKTSKTRAAIVISIWRLVM